MLHASLVAVLLAFELVSQAPNPGSSWVAVQSKEGGFSFSMPDKPREQSKEVPSPTGQITVKDYICRVRDSALIVQYVALPSPVPPDMVASRLDAAKKNATPNMPKLISEKRISAGDLAGIELVFSGPVSGSKIVRSVKMRLFVKGTTLCTMIVASGPDKPLPPEADRFLGSIRFDGEAAAMSRAPAPTPPAATAVKRKPLGKIDLVDRTPEDAFRTFMMAMAAADEKTLRAVTLPNPELDLLLMGEAPPFKGVKEMKQEMQRMRIERLKAGDQVRLPGNKLHVTRASEVGPDRAALLPEDAPFPTRLRLVSGHWKVDAAPIIAGRKAANAATQ
jgi:hypothetical protein